MKAPFALALLATLAASAAAPDAPPLPQRLSGTGLFEPGTTRVRAGHVAFSPRHPLWSDGTGKRRWIALPAGSAIDKSRPDAWDFPPGTRLWKEFAYGKPVETRFIERLADGSWRFATYVWNEAGTDAALAPEDGVEAPVAHAPGGSYAVPSRLDCLACHEGPAVPVLGHSAVQLEDPLAAVAANGLEHRALGYLHGNCGHCHNDAALGGVGLALAQQAARPADSRDRAIASLLPRAATIERRLHAANPMTRMPPLGTRVVDPEGVALVTRWLRELQRPQGEGR